MGAYTDSSNREHGFIDQDGKLTVINYPGAANTSPSGLNDNDVVVGTYYNSDFSQYHGFVWKNGESKSVSDPTDIDHTSANGINNAGEIVGTLGNSNAGFKATGCVLP